MFAFACSLSLVAFTCPFAFAFQENVERCAVLHSAHHQAPG